MQDRKNIIFYLYVFAQRQKNIRHQDVMTEWSWCARQDSNLRPSESESDALSN